MAGERQEEEEGRSEEGMKEERRGEEVVAVGEVVGEEGWREAEAEAVVEE